MKKTKKQKHHTRLSTKEQFCKLHGRLEDVFNDLLKLSEAKGVLIPWGIVQGIEDFMSDYQDHMDNTGGPSMSTCKAEVTAGSEILEFPLATGRLQ